jgi:hypothetical protein
MSFAATLGLVALVQLGMPHLFAREHCNFASAPERHARRNGAVWSRSPRWWRDWRRRLIPPSISIA